MIENPLRDKRMVFVDYDNTIIGILHIPAEIAAGGGNTLKTVVNWFAAVNMIHPELRGASVKDPWADERQELRERAVADWPRRRICPEESFVLTVRDGQMCMDHKLRYVPIDYLHEVRISQGFRPKEG